MVRARTPNGTAVDDDEADIHFELIVQETSEGAGADGTLTVRRGTTVAVRHVTAASCAEAADALALISAMTMDTEAQEKPQRARSAQSLSDVGPPPSPYLPRPIPRWNVAANASVLLTGGSLPVLEPGVFASLNARRRVGRSDLDWEFGLYFASVPSTASDSFRDSARYHWWAVGVSGCPLSWLPGPVRLRACATLEAGEITRTGLDQARTEGSGIWKAATAGVRWQWAMLPFVELELAVSGVLPLGTVTFYNSSRTFEQHKTAIAARGSGGLTFRLPR